MTNGNRLCMYIHLQPPYVVIHTVYLVPVRSCQSVIQAYKYNALIQLSVMAIRCILVPLELYIVYRQCSVGF